MIALTREVPASFVDALSAAPQPIDVAIARREHLAYREALAACGARVEVLAAEESCPDCVFVEDTAVIAGDRALITRPGAPSRRGETAAIARALEGRVALFAMTEPATLDGGDCMRVGKTIYVGRSARTNAAGIARLAEVFDDHRVVAIDLSPTVLHLKCVVSPLGDGRIVLAEGSLAFPELDAILIPAEETYAANVVSIGSHAIVAAEFPRTQDLLARAGFTIHPVPTTQVRKADGSLTCQSILVAA